MMHRRGSRFSIAKQSMKNKELTPLTFKGQNESPSLSPNDRFIIYASKNKEGEQSLRIVSIDTLTQKTIHPAGHLIQEPSWSPYLTG
jgi:TolB protein